MYLQITTRCNMNCAHCYFACTDNGKHMKYSTFSRALNYYIGDKNKPVWDNGFVLLGGGEPTIHPQLFNMVSECLAKLKHTDIILKIITNGKDKNIVNKLIHIATEDNRLCLALSLDRWHESIDAETIKYFKSSRHSNIAIKSVSDDELIQGGRCSWGKIKTYAVGEGWSCGYFISVDGIIRKGFRPIDSIIGDIREYD